MRRYVRITAGIICGLAIWLGLLCGCNRRPQETDSLVSQVTLAGSTSVQPFGELLEEHYSAANPQAAAINVQGGGSTAGVQAAASGIADIGMSSRNLKEQELELGLQALPIARDAIAVIVHPSNTVSSLSTEQVRGVFSGGITSWSDLGGEEAPIVVVTREEGSGTRGAFEDLLMGDAAITTAALRQDSNGSVRLIVARHPAAIGYISLGIVDQRVKALCLDGVRPTTESVVTGEYTLARPFLFLWGAELSPAAQDFIAYVLGAEGQELLASEGLVPVKEP
jgi:phosphate transport system substrate-binding protein